MEEFNQSQVKSYIESISVIQRDKSKNPLDRLSEVNMDSYPSSVYPEEDDYVKGLTIRKGTIDKPDLSYIFEFFNNIDYIKAQTMLDYLDDLEMKSPSSKRYIDGLKKVITERKAAEIQGLGNLLADYTSKYVSKVEDIPVSYEIVKTNVSIPAMNYDISYDELDSPKDILTSLEDNLTRRMEYEEVTSYLKNISKAVMDVNNRSNWGNQKILSVKGLYGNVDIPDWAKPHNNIEQRVRQFYKFHSVPNKSGGDGDAKPAGAVKQRLLDNLYPSSPEKWNGDKKGFNSNGQIDLSDLKKQFKQALYLDNTYTPKGALAGSRIISVDSDGLVSYANGVGIGHAYVWPFVNIHDIKTKVANLMDANTDNTQNYLSSMRQTHQIYCSAVNAMLRRTPDFNSNMFHAYFVQEDADGKSTDDFVSMANDYTFDSSGDGPSGVQKISSFMENAYRRILDSYYVRLSGVEIPGVSTDPYDINFAGRIVKKIGSTYNETHTGSLEFEVDENGLLVRHFSIMAGLAPIDSVRGEMNEDKYKALTASTNVTSKYYGQTFFSPTFFHGKDGKTKKLNLVVIYNDFRNQDINNYKGAMKGLTAKQGEEGYVKNAHIGKYYGSYNSYRAYILEDVRILGISSPMAFNRDDASTLSTTVEIAFKSVSTIDNNI